ncbi:hypothetical protein VRY54_04965 [Actinomyces sp. F1_1611]
MAEQDWEEEFRRLTGELGEDEALQVDPPDHLEQGRLCVALVLAPFANPSPLRTLLQLTKATAEVVQLETFSAVWLELPDAATEEEEMAAFLTGTRPVPAEVDRIARVLSKLTRHGAVALLSTLFENAGMEPGVSGQITAKRYVGGEPEEDLDAGLILNTLGEKGEDLLLGRKRPEDYPPDEPKRGFFRRGGARR